MIESNNYIIAEINIKDEDIDKDIKIINSYEEFNRRLDGLLKNKILMNMEMKQEIKDNCKIKLNNKYIDFNYFYNFKEKGKYIIKYIFTNIITRTNYMFYGCESLTNLDLSNFNTQNVENMSHMFDGC